MISWLKKRLGLHVCANFYVEQMDMSATLRDYNGRILNASTRAVLETRCTGCGKVKRS